MTNPPDPGKIGPILSMYIPTLIQGHCFGIHFIHSMQPCVSKIFPPIIIFLRVKFDIVIACMSWVYINRLMDAKKKTKIKQILQRPARLKSGVSWADLGRQLARCDSLRHAIQKDFETLWSRLVEVRDELQNAVDTRDDLRLHYAHIPIILFPISCHIWKLLWERLYRSTTNQDPV